MLIYKIYDPVSSETMAMKGTLEGAQQYVADLFTENSDPSPVWQENTPGEWWALSQNGGPAEYIVFIETVS